MKESNKRLKTKRTIENAMVQLLMEQPLIKLAPLNWQKKLELVALVFILITKISMI